MSVDPPRNDKLEEFAVLVTGTPPTPWIDAKTLEGLRVGLRDPAKQSALFRLILRLAEARGLLVIQAQRAPQLNEHSAAQSELIQQLEPMLEHTDPSDHGHRASGPRPMDRLQNLLDQTKSYEQLIAGLGFGLILMIWTGLGPKVAPDEGLYSGALISTSLILFILVLLAQRAWDSYWRFRLITTKGPAPAHGEHYWDRVQQERFQSYRWLFRFWLFVFPFSIVLGLLGAGNLVFVALGSAR